MKSCRITVTHLLLLIAFSLLITGCGKKSNTNEQSSQSVTSPKQNKSTSKNSTPKSNTTESKTHKHRHGPIKLGGKHSTSTTQHNHGKTTTAATRHQILEAMNPLQIMLGTWQGKTRGSRVVDNINWVWDFKTDDHLPALVMQSDKSPLFKTGRFTWLTKEQKFQLTVTDNNSVERTLTGDFSVEVANEYGDDKKLHRTYKLQLTQVAPADSKQQWQLVFNQKDNNRYLIELSRKRGKAKFARFETIASQRVGTSFASIDPDDYKEKTCIITQGLGTMQVSHNGKSYWVCCTGCKAAFEEDPESWIAEFEKKKKK